MSRHPVAESAEFELALDREDRTCPKCGGRMHVRCRRSGSILTMEDGSSLADPKPLFAARIAEFQSFVDDKTYHEIPKILVPVLENFVWSS